MSITAAGIGGMIAAAIGNIGNIASGVVKVIVIAASITFAAVFAAAIVALLSHLAQVVAGSAVGEVFGVVSMCLPFDMSFVFGNILLAIDVIIVFLIAKKTWQLIGNLMEFAA